MTPAPDDDVPAAKRRLRARLRTLRGRLAGTLPDAPHHLARRFLAGPLPAPGGAVALYWPDDGEIDTRPLAAALADRGVPLALPARDGDGLVFRAWDPRVPPVPGPWGIPGPPAEAPALRPAVVLCPVVAFDRAGFRLGRGGGHYDRALAALGPGTRAVGLAFAGQEVERVPREPHDRPLGLVLTDRETVRPGEGG